MANRITSVDADGTPHALLIDGDTLVLSDDDHGSPIDISPGDDPGDVVLYVGDGLAIVADSGGVRVSKDPATPFRVDFDGPDETRMMFLGPTGSALHGSGAGEPITLADPSSGAGCWFQVSDVPDAPSAGRVQMHWSADEGHAYDEGHNTHLWIFNRAVDLIMTPGFSHSPNLAQLKELLGRPEFITGIRDGIYAADNTGIFDAATSGFVYSAHFYNPQTKKGPNWEPKPAAVNALKYGVSYFEKAVNAADARAGGRALGLAIHYLQDVCQPMHAGLYGNDPGINFQHENYEQWIANVQDSCRLPLHELMLNELRVSTTADWYTLASTKGLAVFTSWIGVQTSPIGGQTSTMPKLDKRGANKPHPDWMADATAMLKLAQRVTTGLLLYWAAQSPVLVTGRDSTKAIPGALATLGAPQQVVFLSAGGSDPVRDPDADGAHLHQLECKGGRWVVTDLSTVIDRMLPALKPPTQLAAMGSPSEQILFRGRDGHVVAYWYENSWRASDLTATAGGPDADPDTSFAALTTPHRQLFYTSDADGHLHCLWFTQSWRDTDLTAAAAAPVPARATAIAALAVGQSQRVFYTADTDGHVHALWTDQGVWKDADLTASAGAPDPAVTTPLAALSTNTQLSYLAKQDGHLHALWYDGKWKDTDLTASAGGALPAADSPLATLASPQPQVYFLSTDRHIHVLWYSGGWRDTDITAASSAPPAGTGSTLATLAQPQAQQVFFTAEDGGVHQLWYQDAWRHTELS